MLLPLTESLYVGGALESVDSVLLEIGTGYFVEVRAAGVYGVLCNGHTWLAGVCWCWSRLDGLVKHGVTACVFSPFIATTLLPLLFALCCAAGHRGRRGLLPPQAPFAAVVLHT